MRVQRPGMCSSMKMLYQYSKTTERDTSFVITLILYVTFLINYREEEIPRYRYKSARLVKVGTKNVYEIVVIILSAHIYKFSVVSNLRNYFSYAVSIVRAQCAVLSARKVSAECAAVEQNRVPFRIIT